ncbi:MAG TPA: hypothetical protein VJH95_03680 [Candidatus Nanoarchaeia archaeon]|nr:hypothetical protein [Candidatus Nanoarchaeia archaeon]
MEEGAENTEFLELGSKIKISGFRELDSGKLVVAKKVIGNYVKKMEERNNEFQEIYIHLKMIHNSQFEVQVKTIIGNEPKHFEVTDFNLFFALDSALNKALNSS